MTPKAQADRRAIVAAAIFRLSTLFRAQVTADEVNLWFDYIGHLDAKLIEETTHRIIRRQDRFPTVSEFLRVYGDVEAEEAELNRLVGHDGHRLPPGVR